MKQCGIAATDPTDLTSSVYVCNNSNTDFSPGETLQLTGNLALTTDEVVLSNILATQEECQCFDDNSQPISCDTFDNQ
jgi:hypothetical protein